MLISVLFREKKAATRGGQTHRGVHCVVIRSFDYRVHWYMYRYQAVDQLSPTTRCIRSTSTAEYDCLGHSRFSGIPYHFNLA